MVEELGEVKLVNVKKDALLASIGFVLTGLGLLLVPLMGARVVWIPNTIDVGPVVVPARTAITALLVLVGFTMVYKGFSNVAKKTGWTLLLEGLTSWGFLLFLAAIFYGYTGWTAMLWWVGLVDQVADQVANVLVSLLLAIIGMVLLFVSASSIAPSVQLASNLFRTDDLAESALTAYKASAALALLVYPIVGAAVSLIMIGLSLASSSGSVPVRWGLEVATGT